MAHFPHSLYHYFPMDEPLHPKTRRYIQSLRNSDDRFLIVNPIPSTCHPEEKEFIRQVRARSLPPDRIPTRFPSRFRSPSPPPARPHYRPSPSVQVLTACIPKITRYYPEYSKRDAPFYSYVTRMPLSTPAFTPTPRLISNTPHSYGPKHLTGCSVFPTMRHSSYSLLEPIERYRYHSGSKTTGSSSNYLGYPTPTTYSSSAFRVPEVHPSRFQLNRVNEPSLSAFHAGRRTLY